MTDDTKLKPGTPVVSIRTDGSPGTEGVIESNPRLVDYVLVRWSADGKVTRMDTDHLRVREAQCQ